jgi:predicted tellurium resistance membrane protein TerC
VGGTLSARDSTHTLIGPPPPMEWIASPEAWISLLTLTTLEVVLGIDNIVFIAILADRVEVASRDRARKVGLGLAVGTRILLLMSIVWIMGLTQPLFSALGREISGRDLILIGGGLFLLTKATREIHHKLEGEESDRSARAFVSFGAVIVQIMLLDIVFSLDSVITAVGVADHLTVMILAVVIAGAFMIAAAGPVSDFVSRHPTVKVLALSFLLLIGMSLIAEGMHQHIPKGYIYFAMGFSIFVEMLNLRVKAKQEPVHLRGAPSLAETRAGDAEP